MKNAIAMLEIKNLNSVQRAGYFLTIAVCTILTFLHNPLSEYSIYVERGLSKTYTNYTTGKQYAYHGHTTLKCLEAAELFNSVEGCCTPEIDRVQDQAFAVMKAHDCYSDWLMPIAEWHTISPIISWLGNVVNLLSAIFLTLALGTVWLFVFRTDVGEQG
jgi:hypothetical protein